MNTDLGRPNRHPWVPFVAAWAWIASSLGAGLGRAELPPLHIRIGEEAPDFSLSSADGKTVKLSDFSGHNVLIDFYRGYW